MKSRAAKKTPHGFQSATFPSAPWPQSIAAPVPQLMLSGRRERWRINELTDSPADRFLLECMDRKWVGAVHSGHCRRRLGGMNGSSTGSSVSYSNVSSRWRSWMLLSRLLMKSNSTKTPSISSRRFTATAAKSGIGKPFRRLRRLRSPSIQTSSKLRSVSGKHSTSRLFWDRMKGRAEEMAKPPNALYRRRKSRTRRYMISL